MTEKICSQGHVIDESKENCSRCNGPAVVPESSPVENEAEKLEEIANESVEETSEEVVEESTEEVPRENEVVEEEIESSETSEEEADLG